MTWHPSGQWCKRAPTDAKGGNAGRLFYFGNDAKTALRRWRREWAAILAGEDRPVRTRLMRGGTSVAELADAYTHAQAVRARNGEIRPTTAAAVRRVAGWLVEGLGDRPVSTLGPNDFRELAGSFGGRSPHHRARHVAITRSLFRWGHAYADLPLPEFGPDFRGPSTKAWRTYRRERLAIPQTYAPEEVRSLIAAAGPTMRAVVLLAMNAGFGAGDLAAVPRAVVDLDRGRIAYPRAKSGIWRRASLWPETVEAIRRASHPRQRLLLATGSGRAVVRSEPGQTSRTDTIGPRFRRLCRRAGVPCLGVYALRRTFATVAWDMDPPDDHARAITMGHAIDRMAETYVQRFGWVRLERLAEHVRRWVFDVEAEAVWGDWRGVAGPCRPTRRRRRRRRRAPIPLVA